MQHTLVHVLAFVIGLTFVTAVPIFQAEDHLNDGRNDPQVEAYLREVNLILRKRHNLTSNRVPSPEQLGRANSYYDDIRYTQEQAQLLLDNARGYSESGSSRIWPYNQWTLPLKYYFKRNSHNSAEKEIIYEGMRWWTDNTCVTFQEYTSSSDIGSGPHIRIIKGSGCWSYMGAQYQQGQDLSLGEGCTTYPGTTAHEFGHALGLQHEHQRPDRDNWLEINWENIISGQEYNFDKNTVLTDVDFENTGYDPSSIMHYDSLGFSTDYWGKLRTMEPFREAQVTAIGQHTRLSFYDVKRINYYYNCLETNCNGVSLSRACEHGGYQDPKNCHVCRCPPGTSGDFCEDVAPAENMSTCGGTIVIPSCSTQTLQLPTYPSNYNSDASCTWRVTTASCGLVFAFENDPDMSCSYADTCYDFVEVRTNVSALPTPGDFFCKCGEHEGRVASVDGSEAYVHFRSTSSLNGGSGGTGFQLTVYATCGSTTASSLDPTCTITESGFDGQPGATFPQCPTSDVAQPPTEACASTRH